MSLSSDRPDGGDGVLVEVVVFVVLRTGEVLQLRGEVGMAVCEFGGSGGDQRGLVCVFAGVICVLEKFDNQFVTARRESSRVNPRFRLFPP